MIRYSDTFVFSAAPESKPNRHTTIATLADQVCSLAWMYTVSYIKQGTFMLLGFAVSNALAALQDELNVDLVAIMGDLCYAGLSSDMPRLNITKEDEFEHVCTTSLCRCLNVT